MRSLLTALALVAATSGAAHAQARWTMVRSETLTVIGDRPAATLRDIAIQIEQFRDVVSGAFSGAGRAPGEPTVVYVFSTRELMRLFLPLSNGRPIEVAGLMSANGEANRIIMTTEYLEQSAAIAFHEYTHVLIANTGARMPVWLNEGLSEYYSTYALRDGGRTADIGRPVGAHVAYLRERWMPLTEMIGVQSSNQLHNESELRTLLYPQAWALVHYLMAEVPDATSRMNAYIARSEEGLSPSDAFVRAFGAPIEDFDRRLRLYARRELFRLRRYRFDEKVVAKTPAPPQTLSAAEADAWLGDLLLAVDRQLEAGPRIERAATREPNLAVAQLALGRLRRAQGRTSESLAALRSAAALDRDDFAIQFGTAAAHLRERLDGDASSAVLAALRRAVALRPDSAEAHGWLAYVAMQSPETLAEARKGIEQAMGLDKNRLDYRLRFAEILMLQGETVAARRLFEIVAAAKAGEVSRMAAAQLERLDARQGRAPAARSPSATASADPEDPDTAPGADSAPPLARSAAPPESREDALRRRNRSLSFSLPATAAGETRTFGRLVEVECRPGGAVRFHLVADGQIIAATAPRFDKVDLVQFRDQNNATLDCGPRTRPDVVYLTWRSNTLAGQDARVAVALWFMPDDFTP